MSFSCELNFLFSLANKRLLVWTWTSVNARVHKALVTYRLICAVVNLTINHRRITIIINKVNPGKTTKIVEEVETDLNGISIIGESSSSSSASHMLRLPAIDLYQWKKKLYFFRIICFIFCFLFFLCVVLCRNNNRRFNNFNQRDNYQQRDFRGGDFNNQNQSNYNNNRYQNGESSERGGGNWNNRGGSRTFTRSSGGGPADSQYGNQQGPPPQQPQEEGAEVDEQREPINTRWQEPPQQEFNNRGGGNGSGGGYGGKWNQRGGDVDYTVPLPRDERIELELFGMWLRRWWFVVMHGNNQRSNFYFRYGEHGHQF